MQLFAGTARYVFALLKRTPTGQLTSGIERRASATGSDVNANQDPIKYSSLGGLDVWDPNSYINYWVGTDAAGQGILGYAQFPNAISDPASSDGIVINYQSWASNPCYVFASFNRGRTAVHETGHYFGLFHTWGDDGNACTGDDFLNLTSVSSSSLPTGLYNPAGQGNTAADIGDTPNQSGSTSGCPGTLIKTDACSPISPGVMYQDMLDYSDDACMSMFTKKQVERMEWVLNNLRPTLLTSLGCQPPASPILLDASPAQSVNPGGFETTGCSTVLYPSVLNCPGTVTPKFRFRNNGLTTLTSLTVGYRLNNGAPVTQNLVVNLPLGGTAVVSFPAVAVAAGANTFKFFTANPNGSADQVPANDTLIQVLAVQGIATLPLIEGFESATFPPAGWAVDNYNSDGTWVRKTPGENGSAGEMFIDNYSIDATGNIDDFKSPRLTTTGYDSVVINFDVAYKNYPQSGFDDTLSILVTKDCGASYQVVYKKYGPTLATAGSSSSAYTTPANSDWRTDKIVLSGATLSTGQIAVIFRNTSMYGNNVHIDNINISGKNTAATFRDLTLSSIISPSGVNCSTSVTPQVVVTNTGTDIITSFDIGYRIGTGANLIQTFTQTLNPGESKTLTLAPGTASLGTNVITAFTASPVSAVGTGDNLKTNDTLSKQFSVAGSQAAPLTEGFESVTFPPVNWAVNNPDQSFTWQRYNNGKLSTGSTYVNTYNYTSTGQIDELYTPVVSYSNVDSVQLTFDVAATYRSITAMDTLTVLVTKDCGNTFTTVYQKWGDALKTIASSQTFEFLPSFSNQWRNEFVDLTSYVTLSPIQLVFRISNSHGNNIFIDNVNLVTKKYPEILRRRGFLILPSPFRDQFSVWYYQIPATLRYINVYNSVGQLVVSKQFSSGSTDRLIPIDMSGKAGGSYLVHLGYDDPTKDVSQWVIKY